MCNLGGEERSDFWKVTSQKAKTAHKCACCSRVIQAGEKYTKTFSVYDGSCTTEKTCRDCARDISAFGKEHRFYPLGSSFMEYLDQCIDWGENERRWKAMAGRIEARMPSHPFTKGDTQ